jgi:adenylylsulfate kinase-like enzyme
MSDNYFAKYKQKYISKKIMQHGGSPQKIILFGTSSSGKSTISHFLEKNYYTIIDPDHLQDDEMR